MNDEQKKIYKSCQAYEQYFFSQILKRFDEVREKEEGESSAKSMFTTMMYETVSKSSKTSLGIAAHLFKQMDKKK